MAEIISLEDRKRMKRHPDQQIIKKVVNGQIIECVNIDALPLELQSSYLQDKAEGY